MSLAEYQRIRLLAIDPSARELRELHAERLPELLRAGDVVVVNDAATFPARIWASDERHERHELRLVDAPLGPRSRAVLFGAGSFRERTEARAAPRALAIGERLELGRVQARVASVSPISARLIELEWLAPAEAVWQALYALGRSVQYSYEPDALPLYAVQTAFATRPWSAEMPSAARPLSFETLSALRARGVQLEQLTHAAGLSATGDPELDRALPLPERYEIPERTAQAVEGAAREGRRVLAIGTTVVRALESSAHEHGAVRPGLGLARLVPSETTPLLRVTGILSGAHSPEESHYRLLGAFTDPDTLARANALSVARGFALHEHGDAWLILPSAEPPRRSRRSSARLRDEAVGAGGVCVLACNT